jgi:hypothetical protein
LKVKERAGFKDKNRSKVNTVTGHKVSSTFPFTSALDMSGWISPYTSLGKDIQYSRYKNLDRTQDL